MTIRSSSFMEAAGISGKKEEERGAGGFRVESAFPGRQQHHHTRSVLSWHESFAMQAEKRRETESSVCVCPAPVLL